MDRSQIRYALFRCKMGTADKSQQKILAKFNGQLEELGLDITDFTVEWDVSKEDTTQIVTGKIAKKYNEYKSLFKTTGKLKE